MHICHLPKTILVLFKVKINPITVPWSYLAWLHFPFPAWEQMLSKLSERASDRLKCSWQEGKKKKKDYRLRRVKTEGSNSGSSGRETSLPFLAITPSFHIKSVHGENTWSAICSRKNKISASKNKNPTLDLQPSKSTAVVSTALSLNSVWFVEL